VDDVAVEAVDVVIVVIWTGEPAVPTFFSTPRQKSAPRK
jgi:hypothetical protein